MTNVLLVSARNGSSRLRSPRCELRVASCPLGAAAEKAWRGPSLVTVAFTRPSRGGQGRAAAYFDPTKIYTVGGADVFRHALHRRSHQVIFRRLNSLLLTGSTSLEKTQLLTYKNNGIASEQRISIRATDHPLCAVGPSLTQIKPVLISREGASHAIWRIARPDGISHIWNLLFGKGKGSCCYKALTVAGWSIFTPTVHLGRSGASWS